MVAVLAAALPLLFAGAAPAAPPEFVLEAPAGGVPGPGSGELDSPRGIAGDPETGHVFVSDLSNARISEYSAWGLFVRSWGWGVRDGSPELQTCGPAEPQEDPDPALCRAGIPGSGAGQFAQPFGVAVDDNGDVYVYDRINLRVQKFSRSGEFLLTFGGGVNKTAVEAAAPEAERNVCRAGSGDVCQAGISGDGPARFSETAGNYIAYSRTEGGTILVGDEGAIQVFELDGDYVKTIAFTGALGAFEGESVNALDVDEAGNVYFALSGLEDLYMLAPSGVPLAPGEPGASKFEVGNPLGVAVDAEGGVYAIDDPPGLAPHLEPRVLGFDVGGNKLFPTAAEETAGQFFPFVPFLGPALTGLATNICEGSEAPGNLYISHFGVLFEPQTSSVKAYGTGPIGCEPPPPNPPEILSQFAASVGREEATVKAGINPRFWPDTTYYVEYGARKCAEGGCDLKAPLSLSLLTDKSVNAPISTAGVVLERLEPGTTYHYRFVAESSGGGPVFGIDPDGREGLAQASLEEGLEATFRTLPPASVAGPCPNDSIRLGPAARLPDCRGYEMISPLDKGNGDVALWEGRNALFPQLFEIHQSAPSGTLFTYTSAFAFAGPEGAPYVSQYLAERTPGGWSSEGLSAPRTESPVEATTLFGNEFQGFSEDLCVGWLRHFSVSTLAAGAIEKYPNLYRRENCREPPSYEALTEKKPPNRPAAKYYELRVQGFSDDGTHSVFVANDKLHGDAPNLKGEFDLRLYEHADGEIRFVCYLPNGNPATLPCAAGTPAGTGGANTSIVHNAVSADGSRIFWSAYAGSPTIGNEPAAPGQIFARIDGTETRKVSTTKANDPAFFWTASDDGSRAIFAFESGPLKDQLYEVDVDAGTPTLIAKEVEGPMGASEDASRIYFVSKEELGDDGPATAGEHNLYLYEADPGGGGGAFTFIMELGGRDVGGSTAEPAPIDEVPFQRSARVSPDGLHAAFTSVVSPAPTGYDNLDADSGEPAQEVYLYDAVEEELRCVSCNATGARPLAADISVSSSPFFAAARIQGWETLLHAPRVLSEDGGRVFFESFEALVPRDSNSTWDVYQWEEEGRGTCTKEHDTFSVDSGGCVDLISSGVSPAKSTFLDADPSGDNVFFSTQSSLVGSDYGLNDVYVARVGGGFPEPAVPDVCEGEACQPAPPPPGDVTPATETAAGPGNVRQRRARRCPRGKRRVKKRPGKTRCVRRKGNANKTGRAKR